ncbi:MAG: PAS domain S-box protein [Euryarchaeota archaeon]|nr:PAS domain S-box protein [Euryarchaeota archaeon]
MSIRSEDHRNLQRLFDISVGMLWIMDTDGHLLKINRAWHEVLGVDLSRIEDPPLLYHFVHPEDRTRARDAMEEAVRKGSVRRVKTRFLTEDGETRWMVWSAVVDPANNNVFGNADDITEEMAAEDALRTNEARSGAIIEEAHEAIIVFDSDQLITYVNPAAVRMFKTDPREFVGHTFTQILPEERRDAYMKDMRRYAESGESKIVGPLIEFEGLRGDDTVFPIELSISHWRGIDENLFTAVIRDITERKEAEEAMLQAAKKMRRSNEELEQFAYIASHDLQEPLGSVRSYVQLVRRRLDPAGDPKLEKYIEYITDGTERMQHLIQNLLEYSRVETQGRPFEPVSTDRAVHEALERVRGPIEETDAKVVLEALPAVKADHEQLVRVFQGLLLNAVKYRGDGPPVIDVWSEPTDDPDMVKFSVRDTGIGIDPEHHQRIFQIFQRLHGRNEHGGTGIGLATVKKIVERHEGEIGVESTPGQGATFWFTMPVAEAAKEDR